MTSETLPTPVYRIDTLPGGPWQAYRPKGVVSAIRIAGPFVVEQSDGTSKRFEDGWLVLSYGRLRGETAADFANAFEVIR